MPEPYRAAVYYAPEADDALWTLGCAWLGRDPETGLDHPAQDFAALVTDPSRYGFHATLKAPMQLRHGLAAFLEAVAKLAERQPGFDLPVLAVTQLHGFLALCLTEPCPQMQALADACVIGLDDHRRPEDAAAQARRAAGRPAAQRAHTARWGYPLVLEEFRFHMTLTNSITPNLLAPKAEDFFRPALAIPRRVSSLAVFVEDAAGMPFRLLRRFCLQG